MKKLLVILLCLMSFFACDTVREKGDFGNEIAILPGCSEDLLAQDELTNCSSYVAYKVMSMKMPGDVTSDTLNNIKSQLSEYTDGVHPDILAGLLNDYGLPARVSLLTEYTDLERVVFIEEQLSGGNPVIIIVTTQDSLKLLHYVAIVSYAGPDKYIYDSYDPGATGLLTEDNNGRFPGNKTFKDAELLDWWKTGQLGSYQYVIITLDGEL